MVSDSHHAVQEVTVRLNSTRLAAPLTLISLAAAAGCRDASRDVTANDALRRDLELAQASAVSLAPRDLPATRFVSALEAGERATAGAGTAAHPARHSPTKAPKRHASHAPPTPAPTAVAQASQSAAAEETAPAPAPTAAPAPEAEPARSTTEGTGHTPNDGVISVSPTDGAGDGGVTVGRRGHGGGLGGIFGGIIGVVIRGGSIGDDDHCERDHPRTRGGIPMGLPGLPVGLPGGAIGVPRSGTRTGRPSY
jgi:hypothetical protein